MTEKQIKNRLDNFEARLNALEKALNSLSKAVQQSDKFITQHNHLLIKQLAAIQAAYKKGVITQDEIENEYATIINADSESNEVPDFQSKEKFDDESGG